MSILLDEYKTKLVNKILFATSQDDVKQFVDIAIKQLRDQEADDHVVSGFIENINADLALFNPITKDAQQWSNIKMAIILFNRFRSKINSAIN